MKMRSACSLTLSGCQWRNRLIKRAESDELVGGRHMSQRLRDQGDTSRRVLSRLGADRHCDRIAVGLLVHRLDGRLRRCSLFDG